jgi:hypothetical protein
VAPAAGGPTAASDGSTLKASAPSLQSPINGVKLTTTTVVLSAGPATPQFAAGVPLQYRFQVMNSAGTIVDQALVSTTTWTVNATLAPNATHTWRVRSEYLGEAGPWSNLQSFVTVDPAIINDPLTNGRTSGQQLGGRFVSGGWQSNSLTDAINYDVPTCPFCTLEFDLTNVGSQEGFPFEKDLKFVTMGEAGAFGDFNAFRDHPWKMHLVQRADYPTGLEIIWRNGGSNASGGDPGDHRIKLTDTPIRFNSSSVYHFLLDWDGRGYSIAINGITVMQDGWDHWFEPPNFRVSLGCYPRADSFVGAIYRNVLLKKKQ